MNCLIVDSSPVTILGYSSILNNYFPQCQPHTVASLEAASAFVKSNANLDISFVLINVKVGELDVVNKVSDFLRLAAYYSLRCIVVADQRDDQLLPKFEACTLHGFLLRDESIFNIVQAINVVCGGGKYFHANKPSLVFQAQPEKLVFTERQKDVIDLLLMGYSNKKIASTLNLSQGTVKNYLFDLMRYMGVNSRLEIVFKIRTNGYQPRLNNKSTFDSSYRSDDSYHPQCRVN